MSERRIPEAQSLRTLFSEQWRRLRALTTLNRRKRRQLEAVEQQIDDKVEAIIDGTDGKVRIISDYHKQLKACANNQIRYVEQVVNKLFISFENHQQEFAQNTLLQAIFYDVEKMFTAFKKDQRLNDFIKQSPILPSQPIYGLLNVYRDSKTVFLPAIVNDHVINDVRQTKITFQRHHFSALGADKTDILSAVKTQLHNTLVQQLKFQLSPNLAAAHNYECVLTADDFANPNLYLEKLKQLMLNPESYVQIKSQHFITNRFNIVFEDNNVEQEREFGFDEIIVNKDLPYLMLPVKLNVQTLFGK